MIAQIVSFISKSARRFSMRSKAVLFFSAIGVLVLTLAVQAQDTRGTPGVDYPNYFTLPETSFKCSEQKYNPGFYADLESKCQVFHFCYQDRQESFLCPTGTIFNQAVLTCDVWYKSNCSLAPLFYSVNSGPVMERAGKNLPMLLRLRSRTQNKPSTQSSLTNVLDKVSSLYEANTKTVDNIGSVERDELKADFGDKSTDGSSKEFDIKNGEQIISVDTKELDSGKDSEETYEAQLSNENVEIGTDEEMDANMVYDPVTDGYYKNYEQYEAEWQDSEPARENIDNFYDYRNTANEYDSAVSSENELNDESYENSDWTVEDSQYPAFTKRSQVDQSSQRKRRKPVYLVLDDGLDNESENEEIGEKLNDSESSEILASSDTREDKQINLTSEDSVDIKGDYGSHLTPSSQTANQDASTLSEKADGEISDSQNDDAIYIENDVEQDSYVPYVSQYEDVLVVSEPDEEAYEDSYSESADQGAAYSSDIDDTFVVIPDEYDNVVDLESEDLAMPDYPEESFYRTEMLADSSQSAAYSNYDGYLYSSSMDYPELYKQSLPSGVAPELDEVSQRWPGEYYQGDDLYADLGTGIYQNIMTNYPRFEDDYEIQGQFPVNYESSNFDTENAYAQTEQYPYTKAELSITDSPLELPVTEADLDTFSTEDFNEITESEQGPEYQTDQPEDVYYVLDLEEQASEGNETSSVKDESAGLEEAELIEQSNEYKKLNSSNNTSNNIPLDTDGEKLGSKIVRGWSSDSLASTSNEQTDEDAGLFLDTSASVRDERIQSPDMKSYSFNKKNGYPGSDLEQNVKLIPPVHERSSSVKTPYSSNMGSFDFSTDSSFLSNMGYSESMDFGLYGFGPNMGQFSMLESVQDKTNNGYMQRTAPTEQPKRSPLSAIQEKMRSMKHGKFGAFKKYMSSNKK